MSLLRPRVAGTVLAGTALIAALAGCGAHDAPSGPDSPSAAASPSVGSSPGPASGAASDPASASGLTAQDVAAVEQALRAAGGTLEQADQQLAGD